MKCSNCKKNEVAKNSRSLLVCNKCAKHFKGLGSKELKEKSKKMRARLVKFQKENLSQQTSSHKKAAKTIKKYLSRVSLGFIEEEIFLPYIVDFYIPKLKIAIEVDGSVHNKAGSYDDRRDQFIADNFSVCVIRFDNKDINGVVFSQFLVDITLGYIEKNLKLLVNHYSDMGLLTSTCFKELLSVNFKGELKPISLKKFRGSS